jgi:hypothetical protein
MPASDAPPSAAAALTLSSGLWMKGPAPFMRTQACTNSTGGKRLSYFKSAHGGGTRPPDWERLLVNVGIVLVFAASYLRFTRRS